MRPVTRTAVLGVLAMVCVLAGTAAAIPACTDAFKRYTLTSCNTVTKKLLSVEYFNQSCAGGNGVTLRSPIAVDCVRMCGSGTYYGATPYGAECIWCDAGSSSNSGGRIINTFDDIPDDFVTYCSPQPCNAWSPDELGGALTSGNQTGLRSPADPSSPTFIDESVRSELITIVDVINQKNGGKFIFEYRVESELYYDGLQVLLNGTQYRPPSAASSSASESRFLLSGLHLGWRRLSIPLPFGSTEVRLVYSKDKDQSSLSVAGQSGADRAFVRDIVIEGVQLFAPACTSCAAGTFARLPGSLQCDPCPANTFSDDGASRCSPCPSGQWSPPGSEKCITMPDCTAADYVAVYTACDTTTLTRTFTWELPKTAHCVPKGPAPASDTQPCTVCMAGLKWNPATKMCDKCMPGEARDAFGTCNACSPGSAAVPNVEFDGFERFGATIDPTFFEMRCTGECADCPPQNASCTTTSGFYLASESNIGDKDGDNTMVVVRSSSGNGGRYSSSLRYRFVVSSPGYLELRYFFVHTATGRVLQQNTVTGAVKLDKRTVEPLAPTATLSTPGYFYETFTEVGEHTLSITISQDARTAPRDETTFVLSYLKVHGDIRGAATECTQCSPGYFCPVRASGYYPCLPGTYAPFAGAVKCSSCPQAEVAEEPASAFCMPCPEGTTHDDNHTSCVPSCHMLNIGDTHWDLSPLAGKYFGPLYLPGSSNLAAASADALEIPRFMLSVCDRVNHNGASDFCEVRMGEPVRPSYACQRLNPSRSYSLGEDPAFEVDSSGQLRLSLTNGDNCARGGMARSTNITFVCDPRAALPGRLDFAYEQPHCHYSFTLRSPAACQTCVTSDFDRFDAPCDLLGNSLVSYVRRPGLAHCVGGYEPPAPQNFTCTRCVPAFYEEAWSQCTNGYRWRVFTVKDQYSGCADDGTALKELEAQYKAQKLPLNVTCTTVEVKVGANLFTAVTVVTVFIILVLIGFVLVMFNQYAQLQHKYGTLAHANAANSGWEMSEVERRNEAARGAGDSDRDSGDNDPAPEAAAVPPTAAKGEALQDS